MRGWDARIGTLGALIAWLRGDLSQAEAMLREATAAMPEAEEAHAYLAQLLEAKGDAAGAAAERDLAASSHRFANDFIAIPQSLFWVDPVHGGRKRRS
jgi:Flp pilus assembly protein TadD